MKVLIVGLSDSIHLSRWIQQISNEGWEIHLFPSVPSSTLHSEIPANIHFHPLNPFSKSKSSWLKVAKWIFSALLLYHTSRNANYLKQRELSRFKKLLKKIKPHIVHSLETQSAGYLVLDAISDCNTKTLWWHTNWGSDFYLFSRFPQHAVRIRKLLALCDFYSCECERDLILARKLGYKGLAAKPFPNAGGYLLEKIPATTLFPKERRAITVKGYQGWAGRSLYVLTALKRCSTKLEGWELILYSVIPNSGVDIAAELLCMDLKMNLTIIPLNSPHHEILSAHGRSRISIGNSISDGISTSMLDAMAMGSFPLQSNTAAVEEWIEPGITGLTFDPEDISSITAAVDHALMNDDLVESAAQKNRLVLQEKANYSKIKAYSCSLYNQLHNRQ